MLRVMLVLLCAEMMLFFDWQGRIYAYKNECACCITTVGPIASNSSLQ